MKDIPNPVPPFATHIVGVGGLVLNSKGEVLCVREVNSPTGRPAWKLPGGNTQGGTCRVYEGVGVACGHEASGEAVALL